MKHKTTSIRPFLGSKDFELSRRFYRDLGCTEMTVAPNMSYFIIGDLGFYLQDAYVKDWVDNTMIFLEVENVQYYWDELVKLDLHNQYENVRLTPIKELDWGRECFLHDPSGILWHFGEFY